MSPYTTPFIFPFISSLSKTLDPIECVPMVLSGLTTELREICSAKTPENVDEDTPLMDLAAGIEQEIAYAIGTSPTVTIQNESRVMCTLQLDNLDNVIGVVAYMNIYVESKKK